MPVAKTRTAQDRLAELRQQMAVLRAEEAELEEAARAEVARQEAEAAFGRFVTAFGHDPATVADADLAAVLKAIPRSVLVKAVSELNQGKPTGRASKGTRAPRLSIEEVQAKLPAKGSPWKLADLATAIDREIGTTRNFIPKLIELGAIREAGDDGGRPRPAKLYTTA